MSSHERLDRLADELRARGAGGLRLSAVERARNFKRTWVEMAEVLVAVRARDAHLEWGYEDFYAYCSVELSLKKATVDKLTGSYVTLERHAPNVLERDGLAQKIPTCDAVDYFAKALRGEPANDRRETPEPAPEVLEELKHAVFDEGVPVTALRRRFDPVLRPKSEVQMRLESVRKASAAARKLGRLVEELDEEVSVETGKALSSAIELLEEELDEAARSLDEELRTRAQSA